MLACIEYVSHDHEVDALRLCGLCELDFVQAKETSNHSVWVCHQMVKVVLDDPLELHELGVLDGFKHELAISGVVEQTSTTSTWALTL